MNMINNQLNQLRTHLHSQPSADAWLAVWRLLGRWRGAEGFELGLEYATQALATWPDALRELPAEDADAPWIGDPRWSLVRSVEVSERWAERSDLDALPMEAITRVRLTRAQLTRYRMLQRLISDARTPNLRALHITSGTAEELKRTLQLGEWPHLEELRLVDLNLTDWGFTVVTKRSFPALEVLDVSGNPLTDQAARDLVQATEGWPRLRALHLNQTRIGEQGLLGLIAAPAAGRLRALSFNGLQVTEATWLALVQSPIVGNLETLDWLRNRHLGDAVVEQLARSPGLARVRRLDLSGNAFTHRSARALARSPHLTRLRTLSMGHNELGPDAIQALLAAAEALPALERLELIYNQAGDLGASLIGRSARLPRLTHLDLRYNGVGDAGARDLLQLEERLPRLSHLDLRGNPIRDKGARSIARALRHRSLERLLLDVDALSDAALQDLATAPAVVLLGDRELARFKPDSERVNLDGRLIGDDGAVALSRSPHMTLARHLSMASNQITDLGVVALAHSPHLKHLERLELGSNRIGVEGLRALAASTRLGALEHLGLSDNALTAESIRALLQGARLDLTSLDLSRNRLGLDAIEALSRAPELVRLTRLDLSHNQIGPDAAAALGGSLALGGLLELNLDDNHLGDLGVDRLSRSERASGLLRLSLRHNAITPDGASVLAQSPSLAGVARLDLRDNPLGDDGVVALTRAPSCFASLDELLIDLHRLTERGWRALARAPFVANCERFDLFAGQGLSDDVLLELASSPHLGGVRHLDLSGNPMAPSTLEALLNAEGAVGLKSLDLSRCPIGDDGLARIAEALERIALEALTLSHASITDQGVERLTQAATEHLRRVDLSWNALSDAAAARLTEGGALPALRDLDLSGNPLTADGVLTVARSSLVARLERLGLRNVPISAEAIQALPESVEPSYMAHREWHWYGGELPEDDAPPAAAPRPTERPRTSGGEKAQDTPSSQGWRREAIQKRQEAKKERRKQQRERDKKRSQQRRRGRGKKT
ncbi:MAG: hypothetical protein CMH57_13050 [Myxococcales bacterium]|nr:hypothetical protein [Myxococcales bacterium]